MNLIYLETAAVEHPRAQAILQKFPRAKVIECNHYGEIFNPKNQNFKLQKQHPCLILALKQHSFILPTPEGFGIGGQQNYYFSHMLNCIYDCRYCFLQGMYPSANYVLFVNFEQFQQAIETKLNERKTTIKKPIYFFSGYDGDSLAYEPVSGFLANFLPFFRQQTEAILELRSKSTNISELLTQPAFKHCVVAFSFTPEPISTKVEVKVPSLAKRIHAMVKVAKHGWPIGLRFDPLIYHPNYREYYRNLIKTIFDTLAPQQVHSVSLGPLRFPIKMYKKIIGLYPDEALLAQPFIQRDKTYSYTPDKEQELKSFVTQELDKYLNKAIIFSCHAF